MTVREAESGDLPRLRAIQTVVLAEQWPELLAAAVDGPPVCLVYAAPDPTGYALSVADGERAYLAELAVAEGYRGQGQGSALLAALGERLRDSGVHTLQVTVRAVDGRARSFYENHEFSVTTELPDRYEAGDGLLLEREL